VEDYFGSHELIVKAVIMNLSKISLFSLLITFSGICRGQDCISRIPLSVRNIVSEYKGWRIVSLADLPQDDQKLWTTSRNGQCPGVAIGNFTGGTNLSYVVALMRSQQSGGLQEQLVTLTQDGELLKTNVVVAPTNVTSPFVVWKVPPGTYKGVDQNKIVRIVNDSFVYEKMEAYARQYYYDNGRVRSIVTAN